MKKSVKIILVSIIVILLFIIVFGFFYSKKEKNGFNLFIDKLYSKVDNYNKMKLDMNITIGGNISDKINSELLRNISINTVLHYDLDKDMYLMDFNSNYKGSTLVNGNMYYDKDLYVNLDNLYDPVIKMDNYNLSINGVIDTIYTSLNNALSVGEYTFNEDEYTLIINNKNKDKIVKEFVSVLKKNKDLVKILDKLGLDIKDIKINKLDSDIKVVLYTKDNKFVKLTVFEGEKEIGYITPTEKNTKIKLYLDNFKIMMIISKHKGNSFSITSNIYTKDKSLNLGLNASYVFDEEIEKFNIENAVKLSKDDKKKIKDKFNSVNAVIEIKKDTENIQTQEKEY